jgi:hypothetical protein
MNSTQSSIDRIRRTRKTGAEMMADLERAPWTLNPHHTVTIPHAPGATDVPMPQGNARPPHLDVADGALSSMEEEAEASMEDGSGSAFKQHQYLTTDPYGAEVMEGVRNQYMNPSVAGEDRLRRDNWERTETGLSSQEWDSKGLGMSGQERMAAIAQQRIADDQAKFDANAAIEERRRPVREQSDREFAEWEAGKQGRIDAAAKEREAFHNERRAKKTQQDAADSDAALNAKLTADTTPAPNFTFDPVQRQANLVANEENLEVERAAETDQELFDHDFGNLPVEATPMEAPLPGEETLPPSVAGWAQRRAERGQGGTNALKAAYHREVPEDARSGGISFENWLVQKGIRADMPVQEATPILNRLVPMDSQHVERRRDQFVETFMGRYADELAKRGISEAQIRSLYDEGVKNDKSGDPIMAGTRAVNGALKGSLKAQKSQQLAMNVRKRGDQQNRARSFGVPMGAVQFFDSLQEAKTPAERANVLMLAHRSQPMMGWDKMAAMLMKGEIDNDALSQWAGRFGSPQEQQTPMDKIAGNAAAITDNFGNPGWEDQARSHATSVRGQGAKPPEIEGDIKQFAVNGTRKILMSGGSLTPEQKVAAQKAFDSSSIAAFAGQLGLKPDDERLPKMYYDIFDRAPPASWFGAPGRALAAGATAISDGIRSIIGTFGKPMPPAVWAGAPDSSLKGPNPFD